LTTKKGIILGIILTFTGGLVVSEISARIFLKSRYHGQDPHEFYYPQVARMKGIGLSGDTLNIGILGTSVTATAFIPRCIETKLQSSLKRPVNVFNLSYIGGSIADAYYMYKWLEYPMFNAIIVHQGVGELRLNKYLKHVEPDFSNLSWHRRRLDVDRYYFKYFQLPCALAYAFTSKMEKSNRIFTNWNYESDEGYPMTDSTKNVGIEAYAATYRDLIRIAKERNESIFAVSISFNDSLRRAKHLELISEFNDTLKNLMARNASVYIDISQLVNQPQLYSNPYHFNLEGQEKLCDCIIRDMLKSTVSGGSAQL
jgi:hypothetical protein